MYNLFSNKEIIKHVAYGKGTCPAYKELHFGKFGLSISETFLKIPSTSNAMIPMRQPTMQLIRRNMENVCESLKLQVINTVLRDF